MEYVIAIKWVFLSWWSLETI